MKKIKYQGGLTKLIASKIANKNKVKFSSFIDLNLAKVRQSFPNKKVDIDIASFSSTKDYYDQILSILSYLRYAGVPCSWSLYSDGSHSPEQITFLEGNFEFLKVIKIDWDTLTHLPDNTKKELLPYEEQLLHYAKKVPLGKRLYYYLNHQVIRPTLFLDADIVFYNKATALDMVIKEDVAGWYLPDADWGCLDSRYKQKNSEQLYQINGGFFLFLKNLDNLTDGMEFLKSLNFSYEYFSDQNVFHIIFRKNGFYPLDPRIFILDSADQFDFSYLHQKENMAIRHYTGPVRHKMWQRDWKWQLTVS